MEQETVHFGENNEVDIKRIALSDKIYAKDSFKYFIGYRHEVNVFPS